MVKRKLKQRYISGGRRMGIRLNRKHKDVLFRYLFRDKKDLLELYNALNGSAYENPDELDVVTMEDVIFLRSSSRDWFRSVRMTFTEGVRSFYRRRFILYFITAAA